jgi:hypothetical protein
MRYFVLNFLKNMSKSGREITETEIIDWCNRKVDIMFQDNFKRFEMPARVPPWKASRIRTLLILSLSWTYSLLANPSLLIMIC